MKQKQYSPQSSSRDGSGFIRRRMNGYLQDVEVEKIGDFEASLLSYMASEHGDLMSSLAESGDYNDDIENQ